MTRTFNALRAGLSAMFMLTASTAAFAAVDVDQSFNPYQDGVPSFPGLTPGTVISKANVEQFKDALDPGLYDVVKRGWYEFPVGQTTSFVLNDKFIAATKANYAGVTLGDKPGEIKGFVAGRPFPQEPDASDPRAGEKLAWNFKYGINWGDGATIDPFQWTYRDMKSGKAERTIDFVFKFLNFKHRVAEAPIPDVTPNPANYFRGIYAKVRNPEDLRDTQLLILRYDDEAKLDDSYLYLGFQRRVRRLAPGQFTDSFLGSDVMLEDFEGYNNRVAASKWTYKGTKNVLMPFYNHNDLPEFDTSKKFDDGFQFVAFGGEGGCFPKISWQLRKTYMVEAVPVDPASPISKREFVIDAQTFALSRTMIYDKSGNLWKTFMISKSHPDHHLPINKGTGIPLDDAASMVDLQAMHCTQVQFKGQVDPKKLSPTDFTVQNMRGE